LFIAVYTSSGDEKFVVSAASFKDLKKKKFAWILDNQLDGNGDDHVFSWKCYQKYSTPEFCSVDKRFKAIATFLLELSFLFRNVHKSNQSPQKKIIALFVVTFLCIPIFRIFFVSACRIFTFLLQGVKPSWVWAMQVIGRL